MHRNQINEINCWRDKELSNYSWLMKRKKRESPPRDVVELRYIVGVECWIRCYPVGRGFLMPSFCKRDRSVLG